MHDESRHPTHHGQIRDQCGKLRPKLARECVGERGLRRGPAAATPPPMAPILRDMRRDRRQLGHLMASGIADRVPRVQRPRAAATGVRRKVDDRIDALGRHQRALVPGMSRLSARLPSTFQTPAAHALAPREAIR